MSPKAQNQLPDRAELENLKRADIQKLSKQRGLKANLKTEVLIDLLLDSENSDSTKSDTQREPSNSTKASTERSNSIVVHDSESDREQDNTEELQSDSEQETNRRTTRSGKAKELQTALGVGRPRSGLRSTSKASTVGRDHREVKSDEGPEMIPEESSDISSQLADTTKHCSNTYSNPLSHQPEGGKSSSPSVSEKIELALRPLHAQIAALKTEVQSMQALRREVDALKAQAEESRRTVEILTLEIHTLKDDTGRDSRPTSNAAGVVAHNNINNFDNTRISDSIQSHLCNPTVPQPGQNLQHPGVAPRLIGKRSRDSTSSVISGVVDADQVNDLSENELAATVVRPLRKRLRVTTPSQAGSSEGPEDNGAGNGNPSAVPPTDTNAPPTAALPAYYGARTPSPRPVPEDPLNLGVASTPSSAFPATLPVFSNEPPTSPSPQHNRVVFPPPIPAGIAHRSISPIKPNYLTINPAKLSGTSVVEQSDSLRNAVVPRQLSPPDLGGDLFESLQSGLALPGSSDHRTMYGTELERDNRFGDFGFTGASNTLWSGSSFLDQY